VKPAISPIGSRGRARRCRRGRTRAPTASPRGGLPGLSQPSQSTPNEILHSGQSQFTDLVGGKPLGRTIAWINRRGVALDPSVPRPDFTFSDIASLIG
jgi:hypothetical protein